MSPRRAVALVALVAIATQGCASVAPSTSSSQAEQPAPTRVEVKAEGAAAPPSPSAPPTPAPPAAEAQSSSPPALSVGPARTPAPAREGPPSATSTMSPPPVAPALPGPPPVGAPVPGPPPAPRRFVVFNFDNADVEVVVQAASEIAGFSYVIAPAARGKKVTVQTQGRIASDEVLGLLLTILDVNGLAAVRTGNLYRIIPREGAPQTPVRTIVGRELPDGISADEIVSQVVPLQYVGAAEMAALLRPFVPAQGGLAPHPQTNLLIITDTAANVRRLLDIVKLTDVQVALEEIQIIVLKHADAQEMAQLLTQLFATGRLRPAAVGAPGAPPPPPAAPAAPGAPVAPRAPAAPGAPSDASAERAPLIVAERRSNALVVHARKQEMGTIRRLIDELDIDLYGGQRVFIHFAENTKAKDLATTLDAIYGKGTGPAITGTQTGVGGVGSTTTGRQTSQPYGAPPTSTGAASGRAAAARGAALTGGDETGPGAASEVRFIADEVTNAVIVTTYPRNWKEIEDTIKRLDKMPRQVLIEVLAAEVTLTDDMRLGIEWAIRSGRFQASFSQPVSGGTGFIPGRLPSAISAAGATGLIPPGLNLFAFATDKFLSALNALAAENKVNVLSSPSIMTTENKKAVINVSRSVPILTGQQVPIGGTTTGGDNNQSIVGTQTVEYRDAGIILTVTPRIGEQGTVALDVKQEVNDVGNPVPPTNSPEFQKREAETSVVLVNNQTLVLGGLIQTRRTVIKNGIPFLNRIPVLGYLFGFTEERVDKTELLLLITPRVVGTAVEAARLTEEMRRITPGIEESVRRSPRPPTGRP
jgi:general secretion pathway protein D